MSCLTNATSFNFWPVATVICCGVGWDIFFIKEMDCQPYLMAIGNTYIEANEGDLNQILLFKPYLNKRNWF